MTIHVTLWNLLGVLGAGLWVVVSFYLAAGIALLVAMGADGSELWVNVKAALAGCAVMIGLIGVPLGLAAWLGAW